MAKEINGLLNLYMEIDESVLIEGKGSVLKNIKTNYEDTEINLIHDFLFELLESNPSIISKYGLKEVNFQIHDSKIENLD